MSPNTTYLARSADGRPLLGDDEGFVPLAAAVSAAGHELWVRRGSPPLAGG